MTATPLTPSSPAGEQATPGAGGRVIRVSTAATVVGIGGIGAVVSFRHALGVVGQHGETGVTAYLTPLTVDGLVFTASMVLLDAARYGHKPPALARVALGLGIAATVAVNVLHGWAHGPIGAVVAAWPAITLVLVVELLMGMIRRRRTSTPRTAPVQPSHGAALDASSLALTSNLQVRHVASAGARDATHRPVPDTPISGERDRTGALRPVPAAKPSAVPAGSAQVRALPVGADAIRVLAEREFADDIEAGRVPSIRRIKAALRCGQDKAKQISAYLETLTPDRYSSSVPVPATESLS